MVGYWVASWSSDIFMEGERGGGQDGGTAKVRLTAIMSTLLRVAPPLGLLLPSSSSHKVQETIITQTFPTPSYILKLRNYGSFWSQLLPTLLLSATSLSCSSELASLASFMRAMMRPHAKLSLPHIFKGGHPSSSFLFSKAIYKGDSPT